MKMSKMQKVYFKGIKEEIVNLINQSNSNIKVAVAWITDMGIIQALENARKRGVRITIIFYDDKINNKNYFHNLFLLGSDVRCSKKLMHNKFCIIDYKTVINGSYNWTVNAGTNSENIMVSTNNYELADEFDAEFEKLLKNARSIKGSLEFTFDKIQNDVYLFENDFLHRERNGKYPYVYKDVDNTIYYIKDGKKEYLFLRERFFKNKIALYSNKEKYKEITANLTDREWEKDIGVLTLKDVEFCNGIFCEQGSVIRINISSNFLVKYTETQYSYTLKRRHSIKYIGLIDYEEEKIIKEHIIHESCKVQIRKTTFTIYNKLVGEPSICVEGNTIKSIRGVNGTIVEYIEGKGFIVSVDKRIYGVDFIGGHLYEFLNLDFQRETPFLFNKYIIEKDIIYLFQIPVFFKREKQIRFILTNHYPYNITKDDDGKFILKGDKEMIPFRYLESNTLNYNAWQWRDYIYADKYQRGNFFYLEGIDNSEHQKFETNYKAKYKEYGNLSISERNSSKSEKWKSENFSKKVLFYKTILESYTFFSDSEKNFLSMGRLRLLHEDSIDWKSSSIESCIKQSIEQDKSAFFPSYIRKQRALAYEREQAIKERESFNCYVATMVYQDPFHENVVLLRDYRDRFLSKNMLGRAFIFIYYKVSPILVKHLGTMKWFNLICRKMVNGFVKKVKLHYYKNK